jgi:hypothetical protein
MKRLIAVVTLAMLLAAAPCFGSVAISDKNETDGEQYVGEATNITIEGQEVTFDGSKVTVLANGHKQGVTAPVTGKVTNINGTYFLSYGVINLGDIGNLGPGGGPGSGTSRSIALGNGTPGQMLTITLAAATGGTLYITNDQVSPAVFTMTKTGWDDIAMNAALDCVTLLYVDDTYGWIIIGGNSITVT